MKRFLRVLGIVVVFLGFLKMTDAQAYNFGDMRSETLTVKAWEALEAGDLEAVLAYTNKCLELYGQQAHKMQENLQDYSQGSKEEIFSYWALNDVATSLFIQGEAFRKEKMLEEAKAAYQRIIDEFHFGQAWNTKGWFWKPAEAAKEKIAMIDSGSTLDFGDYSSSFLVSQAWKALAENNQAAVTAYVDKVLELYQDEAKSMQKSLTEYPWQSQEKVFSYWALNDVGTALYIKGEEYRKAGQLDKAKEAYQKLIDEYFYAQCWDPSWKGFWKPSVAAQEVLDGITQS